MGKENDKCSWGDGVSVKLDGIHELDPCVYKDIEVHKNVTVIVSRCQKCGNIEISWKRQDNTEDYFGEKIDNL